MGLLRKAVVGAITSAVLGSLIYVSWSKLKTRRLKEKKGKKVFLARTKRYFFLTNNYRMNKGDFKQLWKMMILLWNSSVL
jgi:hypothetical protein